MPDYSVYVVSLYYDEEEYEAADDLVAGFLIANLRKSGYPVTLYEIRKNYEDEDLLPILRNIPGMVVFTVPRTSNMKEIAYLTKCVKSSSKECAVAIAGWSHHSAPFDPVDLLEHIHSVDFVIAGEGEETVVDLANRLSGGGSLADCRGIVYRKDERIIQNQNRPPVMNLDSLPFAARDSQEIHHFNTMWISSARGCLGNCSFCAIPATRQKHTPVWRGRTPQNVVDELIYLNEKYKIKQFNFLDPTFEDPGKMGKERILEIAQGILDAQLDITFMVHMRAENWSADDRKVLDKLYLAGLETVLVGVESGDQSTLDLFNKRANLHDYEIYFKLVSQYYLNIDCGFIMFHPYSTFETLHHNAEFLLNIGLAYTLCTYTSKLYLFPKTAIYNKLQEDGLLHIVPDDIYTLYDYNFIDQRVKRLADKMDQVNHIMSKSSFFHFKSIIKLITYISRMNRNIIKIGNKGQALLPYLEPLRIAVDNLKYRVQFQNHQWFLRCLEWAEKEQSDTIFFDLLDSHLSHIESLINPVKEYQMKQGLALRRAMTNSFS